jgi:hypothetical protein
MIVLLFKFVNFWIICSLYAMLNIPSYPQNLKNILTEIYHIINTKMLSLVGIDLP